MSELTLKCVCGAWLRTSAQTETIQRVFMAWAELHAASDDDPTRCRSQAPPVEVEGGGS